MALYILLDGIPSYTYPFCIKERPVIPGTKRKIEKQSSFGRNGSIVRKGGYEDRPLQISFNILENRNIKKDIRNFKAYLLNKKFLQFSDDDVYYKINNIEIGDFENEIEEYGDGVVSFDLEPFDYAVVSPVFISPDDIYPSIKNIGNYEAEPRITVLGKGDVELLFNGQKVQLKGVVDQVVLDSDLKLAYRNKLESWENKMIGEFPVFKDELIHVEFKGNIKQIKIEPRWRYQ